MVVPIVGIKSLLCAKAVVLPVECRTPATLPILVVHTLLIKWETTASRRDKSGILAVPGTMSLPLRQVLKLKVNLVAIVPPLPTIGVPLNNLPCVLISLFLKPVGEAPAALKRIPYSVSLLATIEWSVLKLVIALPTCRIPLPSGNLVS